MAANTKIFIPRYISSVTYAPARVIPHIYFYNGQRQCEPWYIEGYSGSATTSSANVITQSVDTFPQLDYYSKQVVDSSSLSLLFNNEYTPYGTVPSGSLYSEYWQNYVSLLYNPHTRLVACSAIIPLADYFKMNLNDVVEWRGNYYYLRAINDYNTANGECNLQLLGPILDDTLNIEFIPSPGCTFSFSIGGVFTTTTTTTAAPSQSTSTTTSTTSTSTTSTSTTIAPTTIVTNGLTLWSKCSGISGSIWKDASGNGNDALISGSLPLTLSGSLGVNFISSSTNPTYLTYPASLVASPSSSFTLQLFGSPKGNVGAMHWFSKNETSASVYSNGWFTGWNGNTDSSRRIYYYDNLTEEVIIPNAVAEATRSLYTFVFNEGNSSGILYINNDWSGTFTFGPYVGFNTASTAPFTFGGDAGNDVSGGAAFGSYVGTVNDITVYNKALSQSEINQNYFYMTSQSCVIPQSTTTSTSTSTTSTSTSTTSTTTGAPLTCNQYSISVTGNGTYGYVDCYGIFRQVVVNNETKTVCASSTPGLLYGDSGVVTNLGGCTPSTTSTTTNAPTSTTTTTTAAPTSTSTTTSGPTSTTTTSTTTAAPTSTSTTTSGPTSTSTTTLGCTTYTLTGNNSTSATYRYYDCSGTFKTFFIGANQIVVICGSTAPSLVSGTPAQSIVNGGVCIPTTTSTTTCALTLYNWNLSFNVGAGYYATRWFVNTNGLVDYTTVYNSTTSIQTYNLSINSPYQPWKVDGTNPGIVSQTANGCVNSLPIQCQYSTIYYNQNVVSPLTLKYYSCNNVSQSVQLFGSGSYSFCNNYYYNALTGSSYPFIENGVGNKTFGYTIIGSAQCPTTSTTSTTMAPTSTSTSTTKAPTSTTTSTTSTSTTTAASTSTTSTSTSTSTTTQYIGPSTTTTTIAPTSTSTSTTSTSTTSTSTSTTTAAPTSTTSTTTAVWFGYNLFPVFGGTCDASGDNITAYKFMSGGSINNGDTLYASQNLGDPLATGYYSDGGFRYEVNTGVVSNKTACPGPTSTTTSTSTSTTTLSQINGNGTYECASGYSVCNGAFNISSITGGSGAPYQTSMVLTGDSPIWNDYPAVNSYTGLCGGTNYTFSVKDSNGNIKAAPFTMCFTTSTTTTTTAAPISCALYSVESLDYPNSDVSITWVNCDGTPGNHTIYTTDPTPFYSPTCARVNSIYADGSISVTLISSGCT